MRRVTRSESPTGVRSAFAAGVSTHDRAILVVDDARRTAEAVRRALRKAGYRTVHHAFTDSEALVLAAQVRPAVVLVDLGLPDGRGTAFAAELKRGPEPRPQIIGLADLSESEAIAAADGEVLDDYLTDPSDLDALLASVRTAVILHLLDADRLDRLTELLVLEELGRLLGENAHLDSVLESVVQQLIRLSSIDFAAIRLLERDQPVWAMRESPVPSPSGYGDQAAADAAVRALMRRSLLAFPRNVEAVPVVGSAAVVGSLGRRLGLEILIRLPLVVRQRRTGVLVIGRRLDAPYTRRELAWLRHVAGQVAAMIERDCLLKEARGRAERLEWLQDLLQLITTSLDVEQILDDAVATAGRALGADEAQIWLRDHAEPTLQLVRPATPEAPPESLFPDSLLGRIVKAGRPFQTADLPRYPGGGGTSPSAPPGFRSWLGVPFPDTEGPTGVLAVRNRAQRRFTEDEIRLLQTLANGVAIALRGIRLHDHASRADVQLRAAAGLTTMGRLTSTIVHELMQPMTAVTAMLELLVEDEQLSPDGQARAEQMQRALHRVIQTSSHLRRLARRTEADTEEVDLLRVLEDSLALVEHEFRLRNITIIRRYDPNLPTVTGNADELERVFVNLLVNARDAMEGVEGAVTLTAEVLTDDDGPRIAVRVEDQGAGMSEEARARLFEPLFTTKGRDQGIGLGLYICQRTVRGLRGTITVESSEGQGTRFSVLFPANRAAPGES